MAKEKTMYVCSNCGYQSSVNLGKCPQCGSWSSFEKVITNPSKSQNKLRQSIVLEPISIESIQYTDTQRLDLYDTELNRVLGGGLVGGSVVLIGGEPGIGKSTLLLQIALKAKNYKVLYVSGEESLQQIKLRQLRMNDISSNCLVLANTVVEQIIDSAKQILPDLMIIDSIQTMQTVENESFAGSITQVRNSADKLIDFAKQYNIPIILVGHITKDGMLAGPKILEHMVDTVLQFEGDKNYGYRIIRSIKNRFGSTNEIGLYEMTAFGLNPVDNPSKVLLAQRDKDLSGISSCATIEGRRAIVIETQALVCPSYYSSAQRISNGFDIRRLNMLLAVLEKKAGVKVSNKDVFLNIAGGLRVNDPAIDLSIVASIISSHQDIAINSKYCFAAEIGLSGEIRPIPYVERRISQANLLGYQKMFLSTYNRDKSLNTTSMQLNYISTIDELIEQVI